MQILKFKKYLKPLGISLGILILVFILIDKIIMPIYVQKGKTTKVPDVVGYTFEEARQKLISAGLEPKESEYRPDKRYKIGTVILQNPIAESEVKFGRGVYLTISGGEVQVEVPNLKGKSIREASFNLERYGFKLGMISYEPSEEIFANTIIRQDILPNVKVPSGTRINVVVSQGKASDLRSVPELATKTYSEAEKLIIDAGFRVGKITYEVNLDLLPNTIIEQAPQAGTLMQLGTPIDLVVAQKTEMNTKVEN